MKKYILRIGLGIFILLSTSISAFGLSQASQALVNTYLDNRFYEGAYASIYVSIDFEKTPSMATKSVGNISLFDSTYSESTIANDLKSKFVAFLNSRKNLIQAAVTDIELREALNVIFR